MSETIASLASAPGISGLSVIRVSGDKAFDIIDLCFVGKVKISEAQTHTIHYGKFYHNKALIDTVTVSVFRAPNSYTGDNTAEISCHGSNVVVNQILNTLYEKGAKLPEPGEFTKRAFLNGKLDLTQVEAVADLIYSTSVPGALTSARQLSGEFTSRLQSLRSELIKIAGLLELELDFSEEDLELINKNEINEKLKNSVEFCEDLANSYRAGEILRSGFIVAIAGFPNSGKSTLFNSIIKKNRAIVSDIEGTTRDYIEEDFYLNDLKIRMVDTAGLRETKDIIEIEGIKLVESVISGANLVLVLNDITKGLDYSDELLNSLKNKFPDTEFILVQNKIDLIEQKNRDYITIAAKSGEGIKNLLNIISKKAKYSTERINDVLINQRHSELLFLAAKNLREAIQEIENNMENEIISIDIRNAGKRIGEITGDSWSEDVINQIFSGFCIGK